MLKIYTVNVDMFACKNVHAFPKIGNFAQINICDFDIFASMWHYTCYFHDVHNFCEYLINANFVKIFTA